MDTSVLFSETQRFDRKAWWLWIPLSGLLGVSLFGIWLQIFQNIPFGNHPTSDMGLILFLFFVILLIMLFALLRMDTKLDQNSLFIRYFPFYKLHIPVKDIKHVEFIRYRFIGYGIRTFTQYGTAYNVSGNIGCQISLEDGRRYLIGTQNKEAFEAALKRSLQHPSK